MVSITQSLGEKIVLQKAQHDNEAAMIQLYTWGTPNGRKVSIMLEEVSLPYRVTPVDITKDEQFDQP